MERETVGKLSSDLLQKEEKYDHSVLEQMQEQLTGFEDHFYSALNAGKNNYPGDFFIVVITKRERLMSNVIRNYFFSRESCPTPTCDQAVYKYHRTDDRVEFIWVLPSKEGCADLYNNRLYVDISLNKLLGYVLDFENGSLDKKARVLNNESLIEG